MSTVLIIAHAERAEALTASTRLVGWLEAEGHAVQMGSVEAAAIERCDLAAEELLCVAPDLAVSIGGDGTVLRCFDLVAAKGVPVLGVNVGHLGYLTEFEPAHVVETVAAALEGTLGVAERMMVRASVRRGASDAPERSGPQPGTQQVGTKTDGEADHTDVTRTQTWTGLNEVVLEKRDPGHTVRLEVRLDGDLFATYAADGLIASTPTGSTAYSLSAGGAVVAPTHASLQVTPVAPHMLFDRSLLLPPDTVISIRVISERPALAAVDGRSATMLATGDELVVTRAPYDARFVTAGGDSFHRVLKHKFGLKDR